MYQSLLSVLLMGMVPAMSSLSQPASSLQISIAPPVVDTLSIAERLSASGVLILDAESGQRLYSKQAQVRRPMASLTKLMTAILIVENHDLDELVTIPKWAEHVEGNVVYLPAGERFRIGDLLAALLISSANDAARVLATHHAGTIENFVQEMNERAVILGLKETSFVNPSGLDHPNQWSTPQDVAWLTRYALDKEAIASRMRQRGQRIWSVEGNPIYLSHTHAMLHANTAVLAGKTGTTDAAGQCLVSLVEDENRSYVVVLLNSAQRYSDMNTILERLLPTPAVVADVSL